MKDATNYCRQCDLRQRIIQPKDKDRMLHQLVLPLEPIQKWGLNFVRPFKAVSTRTGNRYIIIVIDYNSKWVKAKALRDITVASTVKLLYECILC